MVRPAMTVNGSLSQIFGGLIGTGPGAGMALLIFFAALIGMIIPAVSYTIPQFRNLEDIVPDIEAIK
jgi:hypothetical protein